MKNKLALLGVLFAETVLAHPGHGKADLFHSHEEWIALGGGLVVVLLIVFALFRK